MAWVSEEVMGCDGGEWQPGFGRYRVQRFRQGVCVPCERPTPEQPSLEGQSLSQRAHATRPNHSTDSATPAASRPAAASANSAVSSVSRVRSCTCEPSWR